MREEWIMSQLLSPILGQNTGRAEDRSVNLLFSSPIRYRLSYEARQINLKAFADNKINVAKWWLLSLSHRVKNIVGKRNKNQFISIFSFFTQSFFFFSNAFFFNAILTLRKQALVFTCLLYKSFENTVGKGEIALKEQFLLFPKCFLPVWRIFSHFHQT